MKKILSILSITALFISCGEDSSSSSKSVIFSRADLLVNLADNHIIADLKNFATQTQMLKSAKNTFITTPNQATLKALKTSFLKSYKVFQTVIPYELGLADSKNDDFQYYLNLNGFPLNVSEVDANINNAPSVNLEDSSNISAQGLPAVDYLLNGIANSEAEVIALYTGTENENRKQYLSMVIDRIDELTIRLLNDWNSSFRNEFISNSGSESTGSVNVFVDRYIKFFEKRLRSAKIGIPSGAMNQIQFPNQIEALYMPEVSRELLLNALTNAKEIYTGNSEDTVSLSSIIVDLGQTELDMRIKNDFAVAENLIINTLNVNLKQQVLDDNNKMLLVHDALQDILISLKNDLISSLSISITSQDNDND